jgi:protein-S-isoprenylcysteine O-methyltransferase Ste14
MTRLPALGPHGEGWVVIQVGLLGLVGLTGSLGPALGGPTRAVVAAGGLLLVVLGTVLATRGLVDLRAALTPMPRPRADAPLVETGAYARVRHPVYGGIVLASIGWALLTASPAALAAALVLLGFFRLKSEREEAWLRERYPGYAAYAARTRRMIPWVY